MMQHVMNRHGPLPGGFLPSPLPLGMPGFRSWWRGGDVKSCTASQKPADMSHLLGPLSDNVDQVLEQLIIARSRLRQGGQSTGVGHEAHALLLHQLALSLLGL